MTVDQLNAVLRPLTPILVGLLVGWGMDSVTAGLVVTALFGIISAIWAWYVHRPVALVQAAAKQPGVQVIVSEAAAPALKELAADPQVPDVVPIPPRGGL